jgi:glycerol-3-phosphate dehydrogenase
MHIGMWLYKTLSYDKDIAKYFFLNKQKTIEKFPAINQKNLKGSFLFYDAVTNDARLCNEIVAEAQQNDAIAFNYCELISIEDKKKIFLIHCKDKIENKTREFSAKYIINATGHWTDETLQKLNFENQKIVAPSKGIHLVFSKERFPADEAILFSSYANDGRSMYAVPWENNSVVIGTTDTEKFDNLDEVKADQIDIQYVLNSIQCFAPSLNISEKDILSSFAGLRPLLRDDSPSKDRARDYKCSWTGERIITIAGGKLTSFHAMAKTAVNKLEDKISFELAATQPLKSLQNKLFTLPDLNNTFIEKIKLNYGNQAKLIFEIISENQNDKEFLHDEIAVSNAEVIYFIRYQNCCHLDDMLTRRLSLSYVLKNLSDKKTIVEKIAAIMAKENNWTGTETIAEIADNLKKYI